jgi:hypothetical protein
MDVANCLNDRFVSEGTFLLRADETASGAIVT